MPVTKNRRRSLAPITTTSTSTSKVDWEEEDSWSNTNTEQDRLELELVDGVELKFEEPELEPEGRRVEVYDSSIFDLNTT
jgi:hypothetical protein